jgi:hypothetical protein
MFTRDDELRGGHLARIERELVRIRNLIAAMLILWVSYLLFPGLSRFLLFIGFFGLIIYGILLLMERRAGSSTRYTPPPPPPPVTPTEKPEE